MEDFTQEYAGCFHQTGRWIHPIYSSGRIGNPVLLCTFPVSEKCAFLFILHECRVRCSRSWLILSNEVGVNVFERKIHHRWLQSYPVYYDPLENLILTKGYSGITQRHLSLFNRWRWWRPLQTSMGYVVWFGEDLKCEGMWDFGVVVSKELYSGKVHPVSVVFVSLWEVSKKGWAGSTLNSGSFRMLSWVEQDFTSLSFHWDSFFFHSFIALIKDW